MKRLTKTMSRFILLCIQKVSTVIWKFTFAHQFYHIKKWKYVIISSNYIKGGEPVTCKGEFTASGVHKQFGISFKTPKYPNQSIREDVRVRKISKAAMSFSKAGLYGQDVLHRAQFDWDTTPPSPLKLFCNSRYKCIYTSHLTNLLVNRLIFGTWALFLKKKIEALGQETEEQGTITIKTSHLQVM